MTLLARSTLLSALFISLSSLAQTTPTYSCINIGNLGQSWETVGTAINDNGQITGYSHQSNDSAGQAFFWNNGTMTNLWFTVSGESPWAWCSGSAINLSGAIVGNTKQIDQNFHPAYWPAARNYTYDLWPTYPGHGSATGINDSNVVIGIHSQVGGGYMIPFKYENGVRTELTSLGLSAGDEIYAINNNGEIAGAGVYPDNKPLFYKNGVRTILPIPGGFQSGVAHGLSNLGQMAGSLTRPPVSGIHGGYEGFITRPAVPNSATQKLRTIGTLGGRDSYLYDTNDFGEAVGWSHILMGSYTKHAIVWVGGWDGYIVDLHTATTDRPSDVVFEEARGINNKGQIVVTGRKTLSNGNAEIHTFLLNRTDW